MTKNTLTTLVAYLNSHDIPELADVTAELNAEVAKNEAKRDANRQMYADAHDVVIAVMSETPMTVADIFSACENQLPEGFSKSKVQYGLLNIWSNEVVKIPNPKGVNTYRLA